MNANLVNEVLMAMRKLETVGVGERDRLAYSKSPLKCPLNLSSQPFASDDHLSEVLCEPGRSGFRQKFPVAIRYCAIVFSRLLLWQQTLVNIPSLGRRFAHYVLPFVWSLSGHNRVRPIINDRSSIARPNLLASKVEPDGGAVPGA